MEKIEKKCFLVSEEQCDDYDDYYNDVDCHRRWRTGRRRRRRQAQVLPAVRQATPMPSPGPGLGRWERRPVSEAPTSALTAPPPPYPAPEGRNHHGDEYGDRPQWDSWEEDDAWANDPCPEKVL